MFVLGAWIAFTGQKAEIEKWFERWNQRKRWDKGDNLGEKSSCEQFSQVHLTGDVSFGGVIRALRVSCDETQQVVAAWDSPLKLRDGRHLADLERRPSRAPSVDGVDRWLASIMQSPLVGCCSAAQMTWKFANQFDCNQKQKAQTKVSFSRSSMMVVEIDLLGRQTYLARIGRLQMRWCRPDADLADAWLPLTADWTSADELSIFGRSKCVSVDVAHNSYRLCALR